MMPDITCLKRAVYKSNYRPCKLASKAKYNIDKSNIGITHDCRLPACELLLACYDTRQGSAPRSACAVAISVAAHRNDSATARCARGLGRCSRAWGFRQSLAGSHTRGTLRSLLANSFCHLWRSLRCAWPACKGKLDRLLWAQLLVRKVVYGTTS
eukprot:108160-Pleurochrysis_carterae.AAC.10